jgi:hypothetical protein
MGKRNPDDKKVAWEIFQRHLLRDANGNPQMVYHGTPRPGFSRFAEPIKRSTGFEAAGLGYWFSEDLIVASRFAIGQKTVLLPNRDPKTGEYERWDDGELMKYSRQVPIIGKVYACYLRMRHPKIYQTQFEIKDGEKKRIDSFEQLMDDRDTFAEYIDAPRGRVKRGHWRRKMIAENSELTNKLFRDHLKSQGYDGVILLDSEWDQQQRPHHQYVVFSSYQIWIQEILDAKIEQVKRTDLEHRNPNTISKNRYNPDSELSQLEQLYQLDPSEDNRLKLTNARLQLGLMPIPKVFPFTEGWQAQSTFLDGRVVSSATVRHDGWWGIDHAIWTNLPGSEIKSLGSHMVSSCYQDRLPFNQLAKPTREQVERAHQLVVAEILKHGKILNSCACFSPSIIRSLSV